MQPLTEYCLRGYRSVKGWLQRGSLSILWSLLEAQRLHEFRGDVAEIGVFHGKLFIALALSLAEDERAIALDLFEMPRIPDFEQRFRSNLERFGVLASRVDIRRCASSSLSTSEAPKVFGSNVRLFSVDGSHEYDAVAHDLALARACLSDAGIIALDDLFSAWSPGVSEAAIDFLRSPENKDIVPLAIAAANGPLVTGASKLFMVHASHLELYSKELMRMNGRCFKTRATFCGFKTRVFDFRKGVKKTVHFRDPDRRRAIDPPDRQVVD